MNHLSELPQRFIDKVAFEPNTGCWLWMACTDLGYARFYLGGKKLMAHRFSYETMVGPIPKGLELDHLCRMPSCVNPSHLEPVTSKENSRRSIPMNSKKTMCPQGHLYDESNTYISKENRRHCRECGKIRGRQRQAIKRESINAARWRKLHGEYLLWKQA